VEALAHHVLLAAAVCALGGAALRVASTLTPRGLERVIATAPIAVALAVLWALVLGIVELGTDRAALALTAGGTWLAARAALPRPERSLRRDLGDWWGLLPHRARAVAGAAAAVVAAYTVFVLRHPALGTDAVIYHLPDVVAWLGNGRPGSAVDLLYGLPVGNYPQATETLLTWGSALSRSFVFAGVWSVAMVVLLVGAGWLGLRSFGVDRRVSWLALAAVVSAPLVVEAAGRPNTDLPALAWLVCCAALVAVARERPALLAPALVAAGLAIGTKTTVAPLALVVVAIGLYAQRAALREHRRVLLAGGVVAVTVGGFWYLRNLVDHGSPLWPLVGFPGSDPVPELIDDLDYSVLQRPEETLRGNLDEYEERLAGYLALLLGALVVPLLARRRAVTYAGLAAAGSFLLWLNAPFTGAGDVAALEPLFLSTVRYLMPAAAVAALCLALATRTPGAARVVGVGALAVALAWSLLRSLDLGFPATPSAATVLGAAVAGAVAGYLTPAWLLRWAAPAAGAAAIAVAAIGTDGYVARHARTNPPPAGIPFTDVVGALAGRADFRDGSAPVAMAPGVSAMAAGDTFGHDVVLIPREEPCPEVEARAREGWVVIADVVADSVPPYTARECFRGEEPLLESGVYRVYRDD